MKIYIVKDIKADRYFGGYPFANDDIAKRDLADQIIGGKGTMFSHPEDFQIFRICEYDEKSGIAALDADFVCNVTELVNHV